MEKNEKNVRKMVRRIGGAYNKLWCGNFGGNEVPELAANEGCVHGECAGHRSECVGDELRCLVQYGCRVA